MLTQFPIKSPILAYTERTKNLHLYTSATSCQILTTKHTKRRGSASTANIQDTYTYLHLHYFMAI